MCSIVNSKTVDIPSDCDTTEAKIFGDQHNGIKGFSVTCSDQSFAIGSTSGDITVNSINQELKFNHKQLFRIDYAIKDARVALLTLDFAHLHF